MRGSLYVGKVSGIKIFIHWTFFILIFWIIFSGLRNGYNIQQILFSVGFIAAIFVCIVLHELGHALTAKRFNFKTRNIMLLPIGGLANMEGLPEKPGQEFLVAIMGPAVNFVISLVLFGFLALTGNFPDEEMGATITGQNFLFQLFAVNIFLALFNLIPAFPMDGGRVLRALLSIKIERARATRIAALVGQAIAVVFVVLGFMFNPFLAFIGLFVFLGAQAEANLETTKALLNHIKVKDVLMRHFSTLKINEPLSNAVTILLDGQDESFIVKDDGQIKGTLSKKEIIDGLSKFGKEVSVDKVMQTNVVKLQMEDNVNEIMLKFSDGTQTLMPVIEGDEIVGVINLQNINEFVQIQNAISKSEEEKKV